jgi:hypothetical protein
LILGETLNLPSIIALVILTAGLLMSVKRRPVIS